MTRIPIWTLLIAALTALAVAPSPTTASSGRLHCRPGEFSNGDGVCQECSWCLTTGAHDDAAADELERLHRDDVCDRFAGACAQAKPPTTRTSTDAAVTVIPGMGRPSPRETRRDSLTGAVDQTTLSGLTTDEGPLVVNDNQLPLWAWILVGVFTLGFLAGFPVLLVCSIKRKRQGRKCGAAMQGPELEEQRQVELEQQLLEPEPEQQQMEPLPAADSIAAAGGNLHGSVNSINMTQQTQKRLS